MQRRRLLGIAGTKIGALCGCLDRLADGSGSSPHGNDSTDASDSTEVQVLDAAATPEVVTMDDDSIGVAGERDEQFLVVTIGTSDDVAPARDEFALETGAESYRPSDGFETWSLWNYERRYEGGDRNAGWIVFVLPNPVDGDGATLAWPGGERELDEEILSELIRPPTDFEVREFDAPASVENGESISLSLTVENVGDADGTFVGALNRVGPEIAYTPEEMLQLDVAAGEATVWEYEYRVTTSRDDAEARFHLNWRDGRLTREIAVETE